ncbi:MAG: biotin--[acetyl-CoA-carboxylase] ligase [Planctomycetes bacterium]|nr:biotin--[acetyl-CoA-carboxylase] ligase [Planctomycetota bacterium]
MDARLFRHGRIDSTNERALAAIANGTARPLDAHVAEEQSAGRGRLGRAWASARGEGLYLTLVLLPDAPPNPAALTMGAGLAVLEGVHALGAPSAQLKWPNDVLVAGAKLAGILVEARGLDPAHPHAVVGVGLNVRQRAFPPELLAERAVTSLALLGLECALEDALTELLERLRARMDEACATPERTLRDYAAATGFVGRTVRLVVGKSEFRGRLTALALGGLVLEPEHGPCTRHLLEHVQALELA